jgi:hypothetical protein
VRITNRLRAVRDREKRYISAQTFTNATAKDIPNFITRGPYAAWLPRRNR